EPRRQDFLGRRPPLALDEPAGELAGGVDLLPIVDRQREEVEALASGSGDDGDERHGVADPDDHGSAGLLGEMAGLDAQDLATDGSFYLGALNRSAGHGKYLWNGCLSRTRATRTSGWIGWRRGERGSEWDGSRPPYAGLLSRWARVWSPDGPL